MQLNSGNLDFSLQCTPVLSSELSHCLQHLYGASGAGDEGNQWAHRQAQGPHLPRASAKISAGSQHPVRHLVHCIHQDESPKAAGVKAGAPGSLQKPSCFHCCSSETQLEFSQAQLNVGSKETGNKSWGGGNKYPIFTLHVDFQTNSLPIILGSLLLLADSP